jgi:hypothetical protein
MGDNKPTYKLILNEDYAKNDNNQEFLKQEAERTLNNYEFTANLIGNSLGWGGNPRWDLIIKKGLEAYIKEGKK